MKKILISLLVTLNFGFANSPGALSNLVIEHKKVNPTHDKQFQTIVNKKEILKFMLLSVSDFMYDLKRYEFLIYNNFLINAEKQFY